LRPLAGIRVVAWEHAVAAPLATRHLADLGANVVKIERPAGGDFARDYDSAVLGLSAYFVWLNRGKRSVVLDLKDPHDRHAFGSSARHGAYVGTVDPADGEERDCRPGGGVSDELQAHRRPARLGGSGVHGPHSYVVDPPRVVHLARRVGREPDQALRPDDRSRLRHGHIVLTEVNPVGARGGDQLRPVVEDEQHAVIAAGAPEALRDGDDLLVRAVLDPQLDDVDAAAQASV